MFRAACVECCKGRSGSDLRVIAAFDAEVAMTYVLALLIVAVALFAAPEARADRRVALVIGNGAYQNTAELPNPGNDANDMAAALKRLGFEVVEGRDLDKRSMERTIRQFGIKLAGADVAFFFYAGHGLQVGGQNYLVPTDARLASEGDVDFESLPLSLVLKQMEREAKTSLVLLDACRDNPLARNLARSMGTRAVAIGQGLAEVKTGVGTLIGFSTQPGNVALDGAGRNSPYAMALLRNIEVPGRDISAALVAVRNEVLKVTAGKQVPWEHTSLTGQVYLKASQGQAPAATGSVPSSQDRETELAFWNSVKESKSVAVLETYLERYPDGAFANLARVLIAQIRDEHAAADRTKVASAPPGSATSQQSSSAASGNPEALTRALQKELKRVGCDPGGVDGVWGEKGKEALSNFKRLAKVPVPADEPTPEALDAVTAQKGRICPLECDKGEVEKNGRCVAKAGRAKSVEREAPSRRARDQGARSGQPSVSRRCWQQDGRGFTFGICR